MIRMPEAPGRLFNELPGGDKGATAVHPTANFNTNVWSCGLKTKSLSVVLKRKGTLPQMVPTRILLITVPCP